MPYKSKIEQAAAQARYRVKIRQVIEDAKLVGCADCPENDPVVLQFHHRDPQVKSFTIGRATGTMSLSRLKKELDKCDVVCANCHLRRHAVSVA
jgi:hypothetical protein